MRERAIFVVILIGALALAGALVRSRSHDDEGDTRARSADATEPLLATPPSASSIHAPSAAPISPRLPAYVRVEPSASQACAEGMALVDGVYCPFVGHRCERFADEADDVCQTFAPDVLCEGRLQKRRFCIDIFEYPNLKGVKPAMMVEPDDARRACALEGKRLCSVEEWEFACEGTQMWPYPYGVERDSSACNIDVPAAAPDLSAITDPRAIAEAVDGADHRTASGSFERCVSPFGVRDLTGNVDEWVEDTTAKLEGRPITIAVKGGAWSPGRSRCRPIGGPPPAARRAFAVGFRCCSETKAGDRPMSVAPSSVKVPRRHVMERAPGRER